MRVDLYEFETAEAPAPDGPTPEPEVPEPEPAPESTPEPEASAWAGPTQEEWENTQRQLQQASELVSYLQTPQYPTEPEPQAQTLPEYDPFDPEAAGRYFEAREERLLGAIHQMLNPVIERESGEQAQQWADQTFERLGVPENDLWREGVLFTSAGFQQFDDFGRPLVHPQQAASQGYSFLQRFADQIRAEEREAMKQQSEQQDETLRNRVESADIPAGPAGGEGIPEGIDELQAARMWRERVAASS